MIIWTVGDVVGLSALCLVLVAGLVFGLISLFLDFTERVRKWWRR